MSRQKRPIRVVLGPLVFIFVFSLLSAAAGIWINNRFYEIEKEREARRPYPPVSWLNLRPNSPSTERHSED